MERLVIAVKKISNSLIPKSPFVWFDRNGIKLGSNTLLINELRASRCDSSRREPDWLSVWRRRVSHGALPVVEGDTRHASTLNTSERRGYDYLNAIVV
jgi:hypothetical protein